MTPKPKKTRAPSLKALFAEWRKLSPSLETEPPSGLDPKEAEKWMRLNWTNEQLKFRDQEEGGHWTMIDGRRVFIPVTPGLREPVTSWSKLTAGEVRFLLRQAREQSGDAAAYRARILAQLALELWGRDWDECLRDRIAARFHTSGRATDLIPAQAHALIEELASRIGRGTGETLEAVRHRVQAEIKKARIRGQGPVVREEDREAAAW